MAQGPVAGVNTEKVKWDKINNKLVAKYIETRKVKTKTTDSNEAKVKALFAFYVKNAKSPDDLGECDTCGCMSDLAEPECPFCGTQGSDSDPEEASKPAEKPATKEEPEEKKPEPKKQEKPATEREEEIAHEKHQKERFEEAVAFFQAKLPKLGSLKLSDVSKIKGVGRFDTGTADAAIEKLEAMGQIEIGDASGPGAKDNVITWIAGPAKESPAEPPKDEPPAATANVEIVPTPSPEDDTTVDLDATVEDLDRAVERVAKLRSEMAVNAWELGHEIAQMHQRKLYLQRRDEDGKPKYKSWTQFVSAELGMTVQHSLLLADVAKAFTRSEVEKYGVSKLSIMIRVSDDKRAELLEAADAGATRNEIQEAAKGHTIERDTGRGGFAGGAEAGAPRGKGGTKIPDEKKGRKASKKDTKQAAALGAKGRPAGSVTAVLAQPRMRIPLYVRGSEEKRAKKIGDDPVGEVELVNGQKLKIKPALSPSGLVAVIEVVRA